MLMRVAFLVGLAGGSDCVAGLADLMVTSCYIEEGATRTKTGLENDVQVFTIGGQIAESFNPEECIDEPGKPPCLCILRDRGNEEECSMLTPLVAEKDCPPAIDGTVVDSGSLTEVCVGNGMQKDVAVTVGAKSYRFRFTSVAVRERSDRPSLLSLAADGCKMRPTFNPDHLTYNCYLDCLARDNILFSALLDNSVKKSGTEVASLALVDEEGKVLDSNFDHLIEDVPMSDTGEPVGRRIFIGPALTVGAAVSADDADTVYSVRLVCKSAFGMPTTTTSTTTIAPNAVAKGEAVDKKGPSPSPSPAPEPAPAASPAPPPPKPPKASSLQSPAMRVLEHFGIEMVCLIALFGTLGLFMALLLGREASLRVWTSLGLPALRLPLRSTATPVREPLNRPAE
jgi:hypothetical protein